MKKALFSVFVVWYGKDQKLALDAASETEFITCPLVINTIIMRTIQLK